MRKKIQRFRFPEGFPMDAILVGAQTGAITTKEAHGLIRDARMKREPRSNRTIQKIGVVDLFHRENC